MKDKIIENEEQLQLITQLNLDAFMEAQISRDPDFMKKMSFETSGITENLLNNELQTDNPIVMMLKAQMIASGIRQVASAEMLRKIEKEGEVKIDGNDAREIIKEILVNNIEDRVSTEELFIEIKEGEPEE